MQKLHTLKSVRVHFAPGKIAITLELLGQFLLFLDQNDRIALPFFRYIVLSNWTSKSKVSCTTISQVKGNAFPFQQKTGK